MKMQLYSKYVIISAFNARKTALTLLDSNSCHHARGGVEDTRLDTKVKNTKKIRGRGQPFRGQTLSRPRTKDTGGKCSPKKKRGLKKSFQAISKKKIFKKVFQPIYKILMIQKIVLSSS